MHKLISRPQTRAFGSHLLRQNVYPCYNVLYCMFSFEYNWEINQLKNKKKTLNAFKDIFQNLWL